jgi:hypothetical protein
VIVVASTNPAFNATVFRENIRATMVMGMPNSIDKQVTFKWSPDTTYNSIDTAGVPYDATDVPVTTETHADVIVPVAFEFAARPAGSLETSMGEFDTSRIVITILDTDWEEVVGADQIQIDEATYDIQFVAPPFALFDVDVYQIFAIARDEA